MQLYKITAKRDFNIERARFTKNMSIELQTSASPFNNAGKGVLDAFVRKYNLNGDRLKSLSPNNFDIKKIS